MIYDHQLRSRDIIALGFMTFALFAAQVTLFSLQWSAYRQANTSDCGIRLPHYCRWPAGINSSGLAKVGGGVDSLSTPIGKVAAYCWQRFVTWRWGRFSLRRVSYRFF